MRPGRASSCDRDGDGQCGAVIGPYNPLFCPAGVFDCDDTLVTSFEGAAELCDGIDNDCDGQDRRGLSQLARDLHGGRGHLPSRGRHAVRRQRRRHDLLGDPRHARRREL